MATLVIIEDERDLNNVLRSHLEQDGHTVYQAFDGPGGVALVESTRPQLVILDWMLPGRDGLAVCREIRQQHLMPILMLSARGEEIDRVLGLEVGADDYLVKPFSVRELLARVRSLLRRVALDTITPATAGERTPSITAAPLRVPEAQPPLLYGALRIDLAERQASLDGQPIDLTRREWDVLVLLATHPGRAFSRDFLLEQLWGYSYDGGDRTVDSHVAQLRRKLGVAGQRIVTVWGVGYRWKNDDRA
ncbi:MAG: response regulator transcription factor [Chloroflexi bacterium]|nr:response regulator transcription factor [Chloroflexota bacterium]